MAKLTNAARERATARINAHFDRLINELTRDEFNAHRDAPSGEITSGITFASDDKRREFERHLAIGGVYGLAPYSNYYQCIVHLTTAAEKQRLKQALADRTAAVAEERSRLERERSAAIDTAFFWDDTQALAFLQEFVE